MNSNSGCVIKTYNGNLQNSLDRLRSRVEKATPNKKIGISPVDRAWIARNWQRTQVAQWVWNKLGVLSSYKGTRTWARTTIWSKTRRCKEMNTTCCCINDLKRSNTICSVEMRTWRARSRGGKACTTRHLRTRSSIWLRRIKARYPNWVSHSAPCLTRPFKL